MAAACHRQSARAASGGKLKRSIISRLRELLAQLGWKEGLIHLASRLLSALSAGRLSHVRYLFVAQPVPATASDTPLPGGGRTVTRYLEADDPLCQQFPRPPEVIQRRFAQGDRCLASCVGEKFAGHIWLAEGQYEEDMLRCCYQLVDSQTCVWDYDVYVAPEFRMGRVFARLWDHANHSLASRGRRWCCSRIDAANWQSVQAHRRLGTQTLFSASFFLAGRWQLMIAGAYPFLHLSTGPASRPTLKIHPPREPGATHT